MTQRSAKTNWTIHTDNVTKAEENAFQSNFGEMQKTGKYTPNEEHIIHHAVVPISNYEHSEGEGSSFTIKKCMAVCLLFPYTFYDYYISNFF
jgi:hypothetical protein